MKRASERPYQRAERGRVGVASIVERASETMLIRLLKIDWPVGFAAAAERERGREKRVFAFGALTAAVAIRQMELGGGKAR